jgi:hypothetical protein
MKICREAGQGERGGGGGGGGQSGRVWEAGWGGIPELVLDGCENIETKGVTL